MMLVTVAIALFKFHNTAKKHTTSRIIKNFITTFSPNKEDTILDYGCGYGQDADYLISCGYKCDRYDPYFYPLYPQKIYDYVICFYVLNVLPEIEMRKQVIESVLKLKRKSAMFVVRNYTDENYNHVIKYKDGYYDPTAKTFNKKFSIVELKDLFLDYPDAKIKYFKGFQRVII